MAFVYLCIIGSAFLAGVGVGSDGAAVNKKAEAPAIVIVADAPKQ